MRVNNTILLLIVALVIMVVDYRLGLGIVALLSDYLLLVLVIAIVLGAIGFKTGV